MSANAVSSTRVNGARRFVQTFVSLLGGEAITRGALLVAAVIAVRALAPGAFGAYTYAVAVGSIAATITDLGLSPLITRDISADAARAPGLLGAFLKTQLLLASATVALGALLAGTGAALGPASAAVMLLAFAMLSVGSLSRPFEATLTARGHAYFVTVGRGVRGSVMIAATAVAALVQPTAAAILLAGLLSEACGVVVVGALCILRSTRPLWRQGISHIGQLLRLAVPFALQVGFNMLYARVDMLMLGELTTGFAVGNYAVASRIIDAAVLVPAYFGGAFLATVAHTGVRSQRAVMQTASALRNGLLICLPLAFSLALAGPAVVRLAAGERYATAGSILVLLSPTVALIGSYSILSNLQVALHRVRALVVINIIGLLVKVTLNAIFIPAFGAKGAAATALLAESVVVVAQWTSMRGVVEIGALLSILARLVAPTGAMVALGVGMAIVLPWYPALLSGVVAFVVVAALLGSLSPNDIKVAITALRPGYE